MTRLNMQQIYNTKQLWQSNVPAYRRNMVTRRQPSFFRSSTVGYNLRFILSFQLVFMTDSLQKSKEALSLLLLANDRPPGRMVELSVD